MKFNNLTLWLFIVLAGILISSCAGEKKLYKGTEIIRRVDYSSTENSQKGIQLEVYKLTEGVNFEITDSTSNPNELETNLKFENLKKDSSIKLVKCLQQNESDDNFFTPDPEHFNIRTGPLIIESSKCCVENKVGCENGAKDTIEKKFKYFDYSTVIQAISIPLKFRGWVDGEESKLYPQTETSFTAAASIGFKLNHNVFSTNKNLTKTERSRSYSFTPGAFFGFGTASIKPSTTFNAVAYERTAATISTGIYLMVGFKRLSIGYALGGDFATGPGASSWAYQGRMWQGLIVGLDLIK